MTAIAIERTTDFAGSYPARGTYGIKANVRVWKGTIVCIDSAGRAMQGDTIANGALYAVGKASATYNNLTGSELGGAADATDVEVEYGVFGWENSSSGDAIAADDVGKPCYVADNQTVALTSNGGLRPFAGIVSEVRDGHVYVYMGPHVAAANDAIPGDTSESVQSGTGTLVAGVLTVNTGITVTANSRVFTAFKTLAGTFSDGGLIAPAADRVVGPPGTGTIVIRALVQAGTANVADTSVVEYLIVG
jgi:hypothetical protein